MAWPSLRSKPWCAAARPERGLVLPVEFVQFAERNELIDQLGAWVLRRACRDGARWPGIGVAVNVSPRQFRSPDFIAFVEATARAEGMPFDRLEIEITESAYFDDPDRAEEELRSLRALGIKVALDDFGTGYASLSYLRRLPLDKIKIDKSFVDALDTVDGAAIVHAIVALARALGLAGHGGGCRDDRPAGVPACGRLQLPARLFVLAGRERRRDRRDPGGEPRRRPASRGREGHTPRARSQPTACRMRQRRSGGRRRSAQNVETKRQHGAEPDGVLAMIGIGIAGLADAAGSSDRRG